MASESKTKTRTLEKTTSASHVGTMVHERNGTVLFSGGPSSYAAATERLLSKVENRSVGTSYLSVLANKDYHPATHSSIPFQDGEQTSLLVSVQAVLISRSSGSEVTLNWIYHLSSNGRSAESSVAKRYVSQTPCEPEETKMTRGDHDLVIFLRTYHFPLATQSV